MSYVLAENKGWKTNALTFEIVNNLEGGVASLTNNEAAYFMWEHFTTKPLVDKGVFRRLGDCPTPWPCFVIAATTSFLKKEPTILAHILEVINSYTGDFKAIPSINKTYSKDTSYKQYVKNYQTMGSLPISTNNAFVLLKC